MKNKKITSKTSSKILILPITIALLTMVIVTVVPSVYANATCDGTGNHCYSNAKRNTSNRGGSATIYINSGNTVQSGYAIANPVWINFLDGSWLEAGWQKGNILPCSSTTAKFYTYEKVSSGSGICVGTTSGSTMSAQITDSNLDGVWQIYVNGALKQSVFKSTNSNKMTVGGESTHLSNVLTGGRDTNLTIISTSGISSSWGSTIVPTYSSHLHNYVYAWNTQYTDFTYGGP
ncbi:MAG: hypothetical protein ACREAK_06130 [Nitrosarchaeum sp.]